MQGYGHATGDSHKKKKRIAIITVSSLILVAMVVAVAVGVKGTSKASTESAGQPSGDIKASQKAIEAICKPTDYKETCIKSLSGVAGNTSDPKELIKASFTVAMDNIKVALKNSNTMKELEKDKGAKDALRICQELMEFAIDDLKRSFDESGKFDLTHMDKFVDDLKVWLGASLTFQETCLEGFENTTGNAGEAMRKALKSSNELTRNGIAIVDKITSIISSFGFQFKRRLLSETEANVDGFPSWVTPQKRRLLQANVIKANVVVAQDGTGKYKTITEALNEVPNKSAQPFVIHIKQGVYVETVRVLKTMTNVVFIGDGPLKTKVTGKRSFGGGYKTIDTATVAVMGDGFIAKNIGFENSAGAVNHQAVALRVQSDRSVFFNCQMDGYQDTLYVHTYRQFYRDCTVSGTIDFIFGNAQAVLQNCRLVVRKPLDNQLNAVTAQGRNERHETSAIVLQGCSIVADPLYFPVRHTIKTYLGRPWKAYSRTIIMHTQLDDFIQPAGWHEWNGPLYLDTCFYSEYQNKGPGSNLAGRVKWPCIKTITPNEALEFTPAKYFTGDEWIKQAAVPYIPGMLR
ncbi:hypothetical protein IFM89_032634 [Coptis chinensis]|uniref:Pectinesterase n=1 Tax=Coptis chinensis TaxID=261450 RepID=A0A835HNZ2_9MAGN|nr:hypothetical protein IFM89_032634 [Coptis chinensis]